MTTTQQRACEACARELAESSEMLGHRCGRLDRLGGNEIRPRTPSATAMLAPRGAPNPGEPIGCLICKSASVSAEGLCENPACWDWIRTHRYPHHDRYAPNGPTWQEGIDDERGLAQWEAENDAAG